MTLLELPDLLPQARSHQEWLADRLERRACVPVYVLGYHSAGGRRYLLRSGFFGEFVARRVRIFGDWHEAIAAGRSYGVDVISLWARP